MNRYDYISDEYLPTMIEQYSLSDSVISFELVDELRRREKEKRELMTMEEQISEIVDNFDFETTRIIMDSVNMIWSGIERVPSIEELKGFVTAALIEVWNDEEQLDNNYCTLSIGGFNAVRWIYDGYKVLELHFTPCSYEMHYESVIKNS